MLSLRIFPSTSRGETLIGGLLLLIPAGIGLLLSGTPRVGSPFPILTFLPALLLSWQHLQIAAIALPSLLFFAWNPSLFRGDGHVPRRSYILFAVLSALSVVYFVGSWNFGVTYQGLVHMRVVCLINVVFILALTQGFMRALKAAASFRLNLVSHWTLFAWLAWYAFPFLGEPPKRLSPR